MKYILQFTKLNCHYPICHKSFFLFHQLQHFLLTFFKLPRRKMQAHKRTSEWATVSCILQATWNLALLIITQYEKNAMFFSNTLEPSEISYFFNMCVWVNNCNSNDYLIIRLYKFFILKTRIVYWICNIFRSFKMYKKI